MVDTLANKRGKQQMEKKKIIIADDEPNIRLLVKGILSKDYVILEARNGEEAIDIPSIISIFSFTTCFPIRSGNHGATYTEIFIAT